jgi:hypothetical protein
MRPHGWKLTLALTAVLGAFGCDNPDGGFVFNRYLTIEDECVFETGTNATLLGYTYDPDFQDSLALFAEMANNLTVPPTVVDPITGELLDNPRDILVQEFAFQYECDGSLFSGASQLFLPGPGTSLLPFCFDPRDDNASANGFDVVPVSANLQSNSLGLIKTTAVSGFLGAQFRSLFDLSVDVEQCCADGNEAACAAGDVGSIQDNNSPMQCANLRNAVMTGQFAANQISDIRTFARFDTTITPPPLTPSIILSLSGSYRGVTTVGNTVVSNDARFQVELCSGCNDAILQAAIAAMEDELVEDLVTVRECFSN